mgnify:CR=1 FL=1
MASSNRLLTVANRLPVRRTEAGEWKTSPGGLVAAIAPFLRDREGVWVGWTGEADDAIDSFHHDGINNRVVSLTHSEIDAFYRGFSNGTLWPLYHDCVRPPEYHRRWWWPYVDVNRRFAEQAVDEIAESELVWIHDYQLQLVPAMIRERRPHARIGFFLHIPFPPIELFAQLPWRRHILEGLLGADVLGFQTPQGAANFIDAAMQFTEARQSDDALRYQGREIVVEGFPISIDTPRIEEQAKTAEVLAAAKTLRENVGAGRKIVLGVDRLDYTKGIDVRLRGYEELLRRDPKLSSECVFVQVAVPSREAVAEYQDIRDNVERAVGRINGEHAKTSRMAVHYLYRNLPFTDLLAFYSAADVMAITPFRDGMNLVAKEYVAAHSEDSGALVLSEFAGAAHEFRSGALIVNPHDIDGIASTLEVAIGMDEKEAGQRMKKMKRQVREADVHAWAESFLKVLDS